MRVAALISGGKDSCFNMMTCIAEGHDIVALANLRPENKDELDSYMYQTVGHHAIDLYAEAMELPLYVRTIKGSSLCIGRDYLPQEGDEVEDLFQLLSQIKTEKDIEAVSVGAILSDYQRVRVENVCQRLGLKVLAFLWKRKQEELLKEMIDCDLKAIIIKVAALGLLPDKHLGMELKDIFPHMIKMREKFGLNECGEGGEYETFVYDCPLFKKSIVIEEKELVIHSDDAFAPVGYLNLKKCHLQEKPGHDVASFLKHVDEIPLSTTSKWLSKYLTQDDNDDHSQLGINMGAAVNTLEHGVSTEKEFPPFCASDGINFQVAGIRSTIGITSDVSVAATMSMDSLKECVEKLGHQMSDITSVSVYVGNMSNFALINAVYKKYFEVNPPIRICIQVCLSPSVLFQLDCEGTKSIEKEDRKTMYVQSLSLWAPANLGPFSQATSVKGTIFVSGTTALVPSTLKLISGGISVQSRVALIHLMEKFEGLWSACTLSNCPLVNCYVTQREHIPMAKIEFDMILEESKQKLDGTVGLSPSVQYCVVPRLPQGALVEWQAYAWVFTDSDEESIHSSQFTKTFHHYSLEFVCTWFDNHFSCRIEACSSTPDSVDVQEMACNLLREYSTVMGTHDGVTRGGLAKIFYTAGRFSNTELVESFTMTSPEVNRDKIPALSFIPVIGLKTEQNLLVWCQ